MAEREFTCSPSPNSSSKFFLLFSVSDLHTSRLRTTKRAGEQHPAHDEGAVWTFGLAAPSPVTSSSAPSPRCRPPLLLGSDLGPVQNHIPQRRLMEDGEARCTFPSDVLLCSFPPRSSSSAPRQRPGTGPEPHPTAATNGGWGGIVPQEAAGRKTRAAAATMRWGFEVRGAGEEEAAKWWRAAGWRARGGG